MTPAIEINAPWESTPPGVRAPELAATWGRFELVVDGRIATLVEDSESKVSRPYVYGSLYPLAEWIAFNWWFLRNDSRPADYITRPGSVPAGAVSPLWATRHNMQGAGDGFAWPSVWVAPRGQDAVLRWGGSNDNGRVRFTSSGMARLDLADVMGPLGRFVDDVVVRLGDRGVSNTSLQREWEAIRSADQDEVDYCEAVASLGLDPYDTPAELSELVLAASTQFDPIDFDVLVTSAAPDRLQADLAWINDAESQLTMSLEQDRLGWRLQDLPRRERQLAVRAPWQVGYVAAREVRGALGQDTIQRLELGGLPVSVLPAPDHGLLALAGVGNGHAAVVLGRPRDASATRFIQARSIWRFVSRPHDSTRTLIGNGHSRAAQAERAFAAELLAPAAAIKEMLGDGTDDVESVADHFGVSTTVIAHQIENQLAAA